MVFFAEYMECSGRRWDGATRLLFCWVIFARAYQLWKFIGCGQIYNLAVKEALDSQRWMKVNSTLEFCRLARTFMERQPNTPTKTHRGNFLRSRKHLIIDDIQFLLDVFNRMSNNYILEFVHLSMFEWNPMEQIWANHSTLEPFRNIIAHGHMPPRINPKDIMVHYNSTIIAFGNDVVPQLFIMRKRAVNLLELSLRLVFASRHQRRASRLCTATHFLF
mmetsp:Transcript_7629/g.12347  ORF Transcript_7629/g.12347 Transcript_7629/m.12347 type:complete len:219 (+) Transcript_7629:1078-1734(+)